MIKLNIDTIEIILNNFIKKIKNSNEKYFYFKSEYYWCVSEDDLNDMSKVPQLLVGSMKDDVDFLNSLVEEDYDSGYLELERLGAVFKYLSLQLT
jgi:hypothetical protein